MQIIDMNGNKRECVKAIPDKSWPGYMKIEYVSKLRKNFSYNEWYPIDNFVKNNPSLAYLAKTAAKPWKEDIGRVSLASNQTLTDKTKKWESNMFAGYPLWISRGKGEGQIRTITGNSDTTLMVNTQWEITPDKTSQYVISHNVHDPQNMGNTLPEVQKVKKERKKVPKKKK